jgi:imidazolonepropionase-like amidohydrolase
MHFNWPAAGGGRGFGGEFGGQQRSATEARREQEKQIESLKKILRDAAAYGDAKDARAKDPSLPKQSVDLKVEALIPVVRGQMPVVINANLERDIKSAIAFVVEMKLKGIISGGVEAYRVADQLKARNIPVIVRSVSRSSQREDDPYDAAFANAGLLSKAGVEIAFRLTRFGYSESAIRAGINAAAFGLPKDGAKGPSRLSCGDI